MHATHSTRAREWSPRSGLDTELVKASVWWDALRAPAYLGDRVLAQLGDECGAVIRDPYAHRLYWLISPGTAAGWHFPEVARVQVLGAASWVAVPPRDRVRLPGLHWARPVEDGRVLTDPDTLYATLTAVIADALGPRQGVAP
ncbi:MAG: hypothetical protein ACRDP3_00670 [Streptomyces sp.]|uniref:hypothetical protein n=1 Tax=Streptomyces sp. TaxID=1931 RepID=UPI003D6B45B9